MAFEIEKMMSIEALLDPSNIEQLKKAMSVIHKAQNNIAVLRGNENSDKTNILKVGTTLTAAILQKIQTGKLPADFTIEDWEEVVDYVSEYAVKADETVYSAYVFMLYAWFIDKSVEQISPRVSDEKQSAILALSNEIRIRTEQLSNEELDEVEYIDSCLWICLEAMIKLLSGTIDAALGFDKEQVVGAAMMLGMEYGRFVLYKQEHELVTEYLKNQKILDVELAMKYDQYMEELNAQSSQFEAFINIAFEPNFGEVLNNSVNLARAAGVAESEIMKTTEDVDDYFM